MSKVVDGTTLNAEDQYPKYKHFFNNAVQEVFKTPQKSTLLEYNEQDQSGNWVRKICTATFIGFTTTEDVMADAAEVIAQKVNKLNELGYLKGVLAPLTSIELAREPIVDLSGDKYDNTHEGKTKIALMSFIFIVDEGKEWLASNVPHLVFKEGGVPNMLVD